MPDTPLLAAALPRVDFADAYAVPVRPGLPVDPQVWADALFRDPPAWVTGLLGLRESLVGLVGIARGRAYFALVRLLHPTVVRAMLGRAAYRLALGERHVTGM